MATTSTSSMSSMRKVSQIWFIFQELKESLCSSVCQHIHIKVLISSSFWLSIFLLCILQTYLKHTQTDRAKNMYLSCFQFNFKIKFLSQGGFERWFNLTVVNISEEDADDYTCVGVNAGKAFSFQIPLCHIKIIPLLLMQKSWGSFKHNNELISIDLASYVTKLNPIFYWPIDLLLCWYINVFLCT